MTETIHLTLTGQYAGMPVCTQYATPGHTMSEEMLEAAATYRPGPLGGHFPYPNGHTGTHFAYAPESYVNGTDPRVCTTCVAIFANVE